jgi:hypothetical protein
MVYVLVEVELLVQLENAFLSVVLVVVLQPLGCPLLFELFIGILCRLY